VSGAKNTLIKRVREDEMKFNTWALAGLTLAGAALIADAAAQDAASSDQATLVRAARPPAKPITAWAAKSTKLEPYVAPNRLVYRLADVLAAHKGNASWKQAVFSSRDFIGEWISMAPGEKTKTQFYADDRVFWVVQSGQMKVTIEGQEPFIATKHFLVQVPKRLQYSMETVGEEPSLRFQMRPAGEAPDYPLSETPTPAKGITYVQATYTGHGDFDKINHPTIDFEKQIVQGGEKTACGSVMTTPMSPSCARKRACPPRPIPSGAISTPTSRKSGWSSKAPSNSWSKARSWSP